MRYIVIPLYCEPSIWKPTQKNQVEFWKEWFWELAIRILDTEVAGVFTENNLTTGESKSPEA